MKIWILVDHLSRNPCSFAQSRWTEQGRFLYILHFWQADRLIQCNCVPCCRHQTRHPAAK